MGKNENVQINWKLNLITLPRHKRDGTREERKEENSKIVPKETFETCIAFGGVKMKDI